MNDESTQLGEEIRRRVHSYADAVNATEHVYECVAFRAEVHAAIDRLVAMAQGANELNTLEAQPAAPTRDREADRQRFFNSAFNRWLDEGISDSGHTVWDLINDVGDAWRGWENRPYYNPREPQAAAEPADVWYVVDRNQTDGLLRHSEAGPFVHIETAEYARNVLERYASTAQNERWNLAVESAKAKP